MFMERQDIINLLADAPKPDLKGIKKELMGDDNPFPRNFSDVTDWVASATSLAAKSSVSRRLFPERKFIRRGVYEWLCGMNWETRRNLFQEAQDLVTKKYLASLPKGAVQLKIPVERFRDGFVLNFGLGYRVATVDSTFTFEEEIEWRYRNLFEDWPDMATTGVSQRFLRALEGGDRKAELLARHGFQNLMEIEDSVALIKLPQCTRFTEVRNRFVLHCQTGEAFINATGSKKQFWVRGVRFRENDEDDAGKTHRWDRLGGPNFSDVFRNGELVLPAKDILAIENTERRRVLMEMLDPAEILKACHAKRIDGPTKLGNELFEVEIGLKKTFRAGLPHEKEPDKMKTRENPAHLLRYTCPSTDRVYAKFVPPTIRKADEAQAWSHHFTIEQYSEIKAQS